MWYAIIAEDVDNSLERRRSARPTHLARLQQLLSQGRLLVAGAHPAVDAEDPGEAGFTGSLVVAQFDSLELARSWAQDDPYVQAGVYRKVSVKPYRIALP